MLQQLFDGVPELASASASFLPSDLTGMLFWFKADAGTYEDAIATKAVPAADDGDAVYTWEDQSGNGEDVEQATAAARPTLKLNIQNSLPMLLFDGGDYLTSLSGVSTLKPVTFLAAIKTGADINNNTIVGGSGGNDQVTWSVGNNPDVMGLATDGTAGIGVGTTELSGSTAYVVAATFDGSGNWEHHLNGTSDGSGTNNQVPTDRVLRIGARTTPDRYWLGHIGEIICYSDVKSGDDLTNLHSYLNSRWSIY